MPEGLFHPDDVGGGGYDGDDLARLTRSQKTDRLLEYLRTPHSLLDRVEERIDFDDVELTRNVSCTFKGERFQTARVIDLLRPRKGSIPNLKIVSSKGTWRRLSHEDHLDISRDLICRRFVKLVLTMQVPRELADQRTKIVQSVLALLPRLLEIPSVHPEDAKRYLDELWVPVVNRPGATRVLRPMAQWPGLRVDATQLALLLELCTMLSTHYLSLFLVEARKSAVEVEYCYSHPVSTNPDHDRPRKWFRAGVRSRLGELPTSVRIHAPMAKKCGHYSISVDCPQNFLFWRATLLTDRVGSEAAPSDVAPSAAVPSKRRRRRRAPASIAPVRHSWASTVKHGRSASVFVTGGHGFPARLYVGLQLSEVPWRSSARTLMVSGLQTLMFGLFAFFAAMAQPYPAGTAALVVAVLGLATTLMKDEFSGDVLFQSPLQSRLIRLAGGYAIVPFTGWLISRGTTIDVKWQWLEWLPGVWDRWLQLGGVVLTGAMVWLTCVAAVRFVITVRRSRWVMAGSADRNYLYLRQGGMQHG